MVKSDLKFKRESADQRRDALINATLSLIASGGPSKANVRNISAKAGVTQGLIRHYFASKEELIVAAYEHHMISLANATSAESYSGNGSATDCLSKFVVSALTPPVVDTRAMAIWASFIQAVQHDEKMRETHRKTYFEFRDRLECLIEGALAEDGRSADAKTSKRLAIACNAVIDGLWLEGGALPDAFAEGELAGVGLASVGAIIGLKLELFMDQK